MTVNIVSTGYLNFKAVCHIGLAGHQAQLSTETVHLKSGGVQKHFLELFENLAVIVQSCGIVWVFDAEYLARTAYEKWRDNKGEYNALEECHQY